MERNKSKFLFILAMSGVFLLGWWRLEYTRRPVCHQGYQSWRCELKAGNELVLTNNHNELVIIQAWKEGNRVVRYAVAYDASGNQIEDHTRGLYFGIEFRDLAESFTAVFTIDSWQPHR